LASLHALKENTTYPTVAESIAALRAIIFAKELGRQKFDLKIDVFTGSASITKEQQNLVSLWPANGRSEKGLCVHESQPKN
jgi:hypothetical protein